MQTPLRNLSGLIDFECAARWGSFRLAALELHKTPAAVSQQIKQLEQTLGLPLFVRHPRHITITEPGRALADTVSRLLKALNGTVAALQAGEGDAVLRISATHSFSMKWLVPRLHRFTARYPAIDLRVDANDQLAELGEGGCDVAIRYVRIGADSAATLLYREQWVVVYSPSLQPAPPASAPTLDTLSRYPLLYEGTPEAWMRLLEANGVRHRRYDFARSYSHSGLLVQAAVAAQGVALVPYSLACEDLMQGRLARCACPPLASAYGYVLLCRPGAWAKTDGFTTWMRDEVAAMEGQLCDSSAHARSWHAEGK